MTVSEFFVTLISSIIKPEKRKLIKISSSLKGQVGLEIGGPSSFFGIKSYCPVYLFAKRIDGVNFSNETVWEGSIKEGTNYNYYDRKTGYQFIGEASELRNIADSSYDFILSCHSLEHVANPIKALKDWNRVLKKNGKFILVLPDKKNTFDHNRPYTSFEHFIEDFNNEVDESDTTHFNEIYQFHDLSMDTGVKDFAELKTRTANNLINRCAHHHVFGLELMEQLLSYCGFETLHKQEASPFHLVIVGKKK
ncbi:MAG: methyltransferase domain-containing protein [Ilyomonas sp.]